MEPSAEFAVEDRLAELAFLDEIPDADLLSWRIPVRDDPPVRLANRWYQMWHRLLEIREYLKAKGIQDRKIRRRVVLAILLFPVWTLHVIANGARQVRELQGKEGETEDHLGAGRYTEVHLIRLVEAGQFEKFARSGWVP